MRRVQKIAGEPDKQKVRRTTLPLTALLPGALGASIFRLASIRYRYGPPRKARPTPQRPAALRRGVRPGKPDQQKLRRTTLPLTALLPGTRRNIPPRYGEA